MKYISIGEKCVVKHNIDKYRGCSETCFFDWLTTSMNSVIDIIGCSNIDELLCFNNIIRDANDPDHFKNARVIIKSLDYCISIHDLPIVYTDDNILDFIDKYKRRFNRIIQYIKSNEKICFIRFGIVGCDERNKFIKTIKKINENCDFTLVVINNNLKKGAEILKETNLLYINLNIDKPSDADWKQSFLNWEQIFLDIENNI